MPAVLLTFPVSAQQTIHVPADQPTIQAGINAAGNGDTVVVAPGTYYENINFNGKQITVTSSDGPAATTIDGGTNQSTVTIDAGGNPPTVLSGFTITHGFGIYVTGIPIIQNNVIDGTYCQGIYINGGAPTIVGNRISHVQLPANPTCVGSGIVVLGSNLQSPTIRENTIEENTSIPDFFSADIYGGAGISVRTSAIVIAKNIIRNNTASGTSSRGGGIFLNDSNGLIFGNLIYGNTSGLQGGGIAVLGGEVQITNNTVADNSVVLNEAAGFANPGSGLAIAVEGSQEAALQNNVLVGAALGATFSCVATTSTAMTVAFYNNDVVNSAGSTTGVAGGGICNFFPLNHGNLTQNPRFVDPSHGQYQLQPTSPLLDAGTNDALQIPQIEITTDAFTDLAGNPRIVNATGKPIAIVDIGAYEYQGPGVATNLSLTSSVNPAALGQTVIFTATLTSSAGAPNGTVTFSEGSTILGTEPVTSGMATISTSTLPTGKNQITATFNPSGSFQTSVAGLEEVILGKPTTTSLLVSPNPGTAFGTISLTATVTAASGTPSGTVTFFVGSQTLGTAAVESNGTAVISTDVLGGGTFSLTSNYSGDATFGASSSNPVSVVLAPVPSGVGLVAAPNPAVVGQQVTFSVSVTGLPGQVAPSGSVTLREGANLLGTVPLNANGNATFSTGSLSAGTHLVTANYGGDSNYLPGSAGVQENVTLIATAITLSATPNPSFRGQTITMTATVQANGAPVNGTATFYDGNTALGSVGTAGGVATYATDTLSVGQHVLTAAFAGAPPLAGSTSPAVTQTVLAPGFTLSLAPSALTVKSGHNTSTTVQLSSVGTFAGPLSLTYTNLPAHATAVFAATPVTVAAGGNVSTELAISTVDLEGSVNVAAHRGRGITPAFAFLLAPLLLARRRRRPILLSGLLAVMLLCGVTGCGTIGTALPTVLPGTYSIPITATDANGVSQTAVLQLTVTE